LARGGTLGKGIFGPNKGVPKRGKDARKKKRRDFLTGQ